MHFNDLGDPKYIALETFRKSGEGVNTPVWAVLEDGKLYVWTAGNSWKVKRIRNNRRVRLCVSDAQGNPKSEWVEAQARILESPEDEARQRERLVAKYGLQYRFFSLLGNLRQRGAKYVAIEIGPSDDQGMAD